MYRSVSKREINRQRWRERIDAWKRSGQSQRAFCEQHHLGLASLHRWHRIFKAEAAGGVTEHPHAGVEFLPVKVREAGATNLTIQIEDDLRIEVSAGFDPHVLLQVIQVLRAS